MPKHVFISYSSKDDAISLTICEFLENNDVLCWIAPRDVRAGYSFDEEIIEAIENSFAIVLILSEHSNESHHVKRELELAVSQNIRIYPIRIKDILPGKRLKYFLTGFQWIDAWDTPIEKQLKTLPSIINCNCESKKDNNNTKIKGLNQRLEKQNRNDNNEIMGQLIKAERLLRLDRINKAEAIYQGLLDIYFDDSLVWKEYWEFINKYELFENMYNYLQKKIDEERYNKYLFNNLAKLYSGEEYYESNIDKCELYYNTAIEIDPNYSSPWYNLGILYLNQKDYNKAEKCLTRFLKLMPDDADGCYSLGMLYSEQKKYDMSGKYLRKAAELDPKYSDENNADYVNCNKSAQKRILWVDDHPDNNIKIINRLRASNVEVDEAVTTRQALDYLNKKEYNIIITDMERGGTQLEGLNMIKKISRQFNKMPVIIFYTGEYSATKFKSRALSEGAKAVTHDSKELIIEINKYL